MHLLKKNVPKLFRIFIKKIKKNIKIVPDFAVEHIEGENGKMFDYGGEEVDFDLLVTVPTNMGDECILRSGFGDDLNYVPTDKIHYKVK